MKTIVKLFVSLFFATTSSIALSQGLLNSHHDFTSAAWSGEACLPCHTPHKANMEVPNSPLWNHEQTTATFDVYASLTMDATPGQPNGTTKLCFSCHDGTVAIENHSGNTGGTRYAAFGNLTTDLRDDHPVSFEYSTALATADGDLYDPQTTPSGLGGTIASDLLQNGFMQCTSCHDPHISRNTAGCSGCHVIIGERPVPMSLWKDNTGSALCLTCHIK